MNCIYRMLLLAMLTRMNNIELGVDVDGGDQDGVDVTMLMWIC